MGESENGRKKQRAAPPAKTKGGKGGAAPRAPPPPPPRAARLQLPSLTPKVARHPLFNSLPQESLYRTLLLAHAQLHEEMRSKVHLGKGLRALDYDVTLFCRATQDGVTNEDSMAFRTMFQLNAATGGHLPHLRRYVTALLEAYQPPREPGEAPPDRVSSLASSLSSSI